MFSLYWQFNSKAHFPQVLITTQSYKKKNSSKTSGFILHNDF